jgi:type I restriction enzyme, S subunit
VSDRVLPETWAVAQLENVGSWGSGGTPSRKDAKAYGGNIPWLKIGDLPDGPVQSVEETITEHGLKNSSAKLLPAGTLLVAMYGSIGKLGITTEQCATNQAIAFCRPHDGFDLNYLFYLLMSERHRLVEQGQGGTQQNISQTILKAHEVPIAPESEQKRIVSKIDELFSRIDEGERALEQVSKLVERYRQSVLKAAVTGELTRDWREARKARGEPVESGEVLLTRILTARREAWEQAELAKMKAKGITPTNDKWKQKYEEPSPPDRTDLPRLPDGWTWASVGQVGLVTGGLTKNQKRREHELRRPFLRVANVYTNRLDLEDVHEIGVGESELDRVLLKKGDVLVVEGNGSIEQIGRVALWDGSIESCVHQNHLIKVRCMDLLPSWYVLIWCMSPLGRAQIRRVASSTAGLHTLSISKIQELPIPIPTDGELPHIADRFDQMDSLVTSQLEAIHGEAIRSASLRQTILRAAFSGELTGQDPADEPASVLLERIAAEPSTDSAAPKRSRKKKSA